MGSLLLTLLPSRGRQTAATPKSAGDETYTNERSHTNMASSYRHPAAHFLGQVGGCGGVCFGPDSCPCICRLLLSLLFAVDGCKCSKNNCFWNTSGPYLSTRGISCLRTPQQGAYWNTFRIAADIVPNFIPVRAVSPFVRMCPIVCCGMSFDGTRLAAGTRAR
jgi:hypothetical protein